VGARAPIHRVEQIMGMPMIIDVHDPDVPEAAVERAFAWLRRVDSTFSTYNSESEVSRLGRGGLDLDQCSPVVRSVLDRCERLRAATGGYFDHRYGEDLDPSGLVKGWSIDGAAQILQRAGARNFCVEGAGDMRLAGRPSGADEWRVGIRHPFVDDQVAAVLGATTAAVATSATYVRGPHIIDPHTGAAPEGVLSVTIVGDGGLATADAYATAVFAMGRAGAQWAAEHIHPYEALVIHDDDTVLTTPGLRRWRR
jgi:thiamine biosynthesis lipoprotein